VKGKMGLAIKLQMLLDAARRTWALKNRDREALVRFGGPQPTSTSKVKHDK
jgi:hypothetical protein